MDFNKKVLTVLILSLLLGVFTFKTGIGQIDKILALNFKNDKQVGENKTLTPRVVESGVSESFDIRRIVWKGAILLGLRYPIFGSGVETFAYSYYFVRPQEHNLTSEWDYLYNKAHNEYLNYFGTTGFVGFGAYISLITIVILNLFQHLRFTNHIPKQVRDDKLLLICLIPAYISILVTNFFGFSTTTINLFFYIIPAIFVLTITPPLKNLSSQKHLGLNRKQKILLGLDIAVAIILVVNILTYFIADTLYATADNYSKMGDFNKSSKLLRSAIFLHYDHVYEDKLSSNLANLAYLTIYQKQKETAKKLILESDDMNLRSLNASPYNVLYWKTRAKNYYIYYEMSLDPVHIENGIEALKKASALSPTDPKITYSLALYYGLLSDEQKSAEKKNNLQQLSMKSLDRLVELKPDFRDGYMLKAQMLKKIGRKQEAKELFEFIKNRFDPDNSEIKKELESL